MSTSDPGDPDSTDSSLLQSSLVMLGVMCRKCVGQMVPGTGSEIVSLLHIELYCIDDII